MPNRVSHTYYYLNYKKILRDSKNANDPNNPGNNGGNPSLSNMTVEDLEEGLSDLL